jgi:hypothetical protein
MSILPAAPAMRALVEAPHPGDLSGAVTVVVRVPVANAAMSLVGAGLSATTEVPPMEDPAGMIVARIVVLEAALIAKRNGVARC